MAQGHDSVTAIVEVGGLKISGLRRTVLAGSRHRHVPCARDGSTHFVIPFKAHGYRRSACCVDDTTGHSFDHFPDVAEIVSRGAEV